MNDERLRKISREHFSAVMAQSVRVSSMIFFGNSNAVRNFQPGLDVDALVDRIWPNSLFFKIVSQNLLAS
jgi:hypothetical protein